MKAYPIYPIQRQLTDSVQIRTKQKISGEINVLSRRSPSPSPLQRTKSNDSFRSSQSYGNSPCSSRGVSPVQSYLQGQWPKHIRNSLPSRSDGESQTEMDFEDNCENCAKPSVKMFADSSGQALKELRRIGSLREIEMPPPAQPTQKAQLERSVGEIATSGSPVKIMTHPIDRKSRQASLDNLNDEVMQFNKSDDEKLEINRCILTPTDGRRPPRPASSDSGTQTDVAYAEGTIHVCAEINRKSPEINRNSPAKTIRQHPPSPGTNNTFLFEREPPDGAEVVKPKCFESAKRNQSMSALSLRTPLPRVATDASDPKAAAYAKAPPSGATTKFALKPSANSNFVRYKPHVKS